jgi:hypothetical protein
VTTVHQQIIEGKMRIVRTFSETKNARVFSGPIVPKRRYVVYLLFKKSPECFCNVFNIIIKKGVLILKIIGIGQASVFHLHDSKAQFSERERKLSSIFGRTAMMAVMF